MNRRVPVVYHEGNSFMHRRDPRAKLIMMAFLLAFVYVAPTWEWMLAMLGFGMVLTAIARVPKKWVGALWAIQIPNVLGILAFPAIQRMATGGTAFGGDFDFGLKLALSWSAALFVTAPVFTTMELTELTDALRSFGIPELAVFTFEYVILLFYVTIHDLYRIADAQKLKGLRIETKNPITFVTNVPRLAIPMIVAVLKRSKTMMAVLTMRGYTFSDRRELRTHLKFDAGDAFIVAIGVTIFAGTAAVEFGQLTVPYLPSA